jgi:L-Ala-D/L-Glu epimerase / N-acetyl-D-glutamate racemase
MDPSRLEVWAVSVPVYFVLSHARVRWSHHLLLHVKLDGNGGWGSTPLYDRAPHELPAIRRELLEPLGAQVGQVDPALLRATAFRSLAGLPDVANALDQALLEIEARRRGLSVARLLGGSGRAVPITEQLFVVEPHAAVKQARAMCARGVTSIKLKVAGVPKSDVRLVEAVREAVGTDVRLRVDANRGYDVAKALAVAPTFAALGVDEWEEPVAGGLKAVAAVRAGTPLRVMLDESVRTRADLDAVLAAGAVDSLNLKLGRVGGVTAADGFRTDCLSAGVAVSMGCAEDIGPGMSAILHASAAWKPVSTEGVGWVRLGVDVAKPSPQVVGGSVEVGDEPGWGLDLVPDLHPSANTGFGAARLVHESAWGARFRTWSWLNRQRQRADVAVARAKKAL